MNEVSEATFANEVLGSSVPVIVDFWAPLCRPCDAIEPHLVAIADEHPDGVRLLRLNVEENPGLTGRYGILSVPTVILFADGAPQVTIVGARPRKSFEKAFESWL